MRAAARVAVVGGGVMGVWTALWLRRRGLDVVLIDQYAFGNALGSSGDETRVTRSGHGRDSFYPVWQRQALAQWRGLEAAMSRRLFWPTGVVWLATGDGPYELECATTLEDLGIPVERWPLAELTERLPWIRTDGLGWALNEPEAGALAARAGVIAVADRFEQEGGTAMHAAVRMPDVSVRGGSRLQRLTLTSGASVEADAFVFACGPWLPKLFPRLLAELITVSRQEVLYFASPPGDSRFDSAQTPVWIDSGAVIYGLPAIDGRGFKVAPDWPGPLVDPDQLERQASADVVASVRKYLRLRFPELAERPIVEGRVCQYESTPDTHFLIDRHPGFEDVWFVGGGSGHGFKHGPVIGEYAAALVTGDAAVVDRLGPPDKRFALPPERQHTGTSGAATPRHSAGSE